MNNEKSNERAYICGYMGTLEKCAQFSGFLGRNADNTPMYFRIGDNELDNIEKRQHKLNKHEMILDDLNYWNPVNWFRGLYHGWKVGHNERALEKAKRRAARRTAFGMNPYTAAEMRAYLRVNPGARFMRGDPNVASSGRYRDIRDNLYTGFEDDSAVWDLTRERRKKRMGA